MYTQVCSFQLVNQACVSEPNSNAKYTICFFFSFLQINILKKTCPFDLEKTHSIERERKKLLGQPLLFHLCFYLSLHDWGTSISSHFFSLSPYSFSLSLSCGPYGLCPTYTACHLCCHFSGLRHLARACSPRSKTIPNNLGTVLSRLAEFLSLLDFHSLTGLSCLGKWSGWTVGARGRG